MTKVEHWLAWREKCAAALCPQEAQAAFFSFAQSRFVRYLTFYRKATNVDLVQALLPEPLHSWHLFETYLAIRNTREGKVYKQWLFACAEGADDVLKALETGASLLMRDVVREHLRREYSSRRMVSLNQPIPTATGDAVTLDELVPGPSDPLNPVDQKELAELAGKESVEICKTMPLREKIALLAHGLRLSLAHPIVLTAADCRKSMLNTAYHKALLHVAAHIRRKFPNETRDVQALLSIQALKAVTKAIIIWGKSEKALAEFFTRVESSRE